MLSLYVPQGRRSARVMSKRRASLVINLDRKAKRLACLVVDSSKKVSACVEVSTSGAVKLSNLSSMKTCPTPSAAGWSGSAKPAPSRKAKLAWKLSRRFEVQRVVTVSLQFMELGNSGTVSPHPTFRRLSPRTEWEIGDGNRGNRGQTERFLIFV